MSPAASFHRVAVLTRKEFHAVLLDKKSRAQLFVAPFFMLCLFSFAITMEVKNASLAVLNRDSGDMGRRFVAYFSSGLTFTRVVELPGAGAVRPAIENQEALMALHIPENFSRNLALGRPVSIQAVLDGRKINAARIANGYVEAIARQFIQDTATQTGRGARAQKIAVATRYLYNPNLSYLWFTLPVLLALLTQMIALIVAGMSVARERELGTFEQLLVSPLSPVEIVIGKAAPAAILAFCEGVVIHGVILAIFGVPFAGDFRLLATCLGLFILAVTGVGLFISSLCSTQQQAFLGCFTYMAPATLLSGFVAPVENMPAALQHLTLLNPARHIVKAALGIYLKAAPLENVLPEMLWLGGIAAATLTFTAWFFERKTR
ncbi:MAG: ABC transporter permease [Synergistaceae bacterium]|nr:ABC transporter permease [Synergistaceae bacterium]